MWSGILWMTETTASRNEKKSHFVFRLTISIDLYGLAVFRKDYKLKADEPC